MNYGEPFCEKSECMKNSQKAKQFCREHDPEYKERLQNIKGLIEIPLEVVLDFVERWNKGDNEKRVAKSTQDLRDWLHPNKLD